MESERRIFSSGREDFDNEDDKSNSFSLIQTTVQVEPVEYSREAAPGAAAEGMEEEKSKNQRTEKEPHRLFRSIPGSPRNLEPFAKEGGTAAEDKIESRGRVASLNVVDPFHTNHPTRLTRNAFSLETKLDAGGNTVDDLRERLKSLITEFSRRAERKKDKIRRPPTPSSGELSSDPENDGSKTEKEDVRARMGQLFPTSSEGSVSNVFPTSAPTKTGSRIQNYLLAGRLALQCCLRLDFVLDAQSYIYIGWLFLVTCCFLYNAWVIPLRIVFPCEGPDNALQWISADIIADSLYALDTFIIKAQIKYIKDGFWVKDPKQVRAHYFRSFKFKVGLVSILPLDWVLLCVGKPSPWLRLLRFVKVETFWELFRLSDSVLSSPHPVRIARSILHMLYLIHMYASAYYALSSWERNQGYDTDWMFVVQDKSVLQSYIQCFYFATKTATSIGKNPKPENEIEYVFMTCAWLSGVFAFAILIGQIRDVIATATRNQTEYRQLLYATVNYLRRFDVPKHLQERVKLWLTYTWQQQKTLDEGNVLSLLPTKMQADIALHVHMQMLNTVKLFQHCEPAFLRDLVPRLKSIIFLPGDYVCRKGEVGKEMYIVKSGRVDVIGGTAGNEKLLASLRAGSVFGEIALLQIDGMDKRTADVRSAGFSNLFVLRKKDIQEVIKDYPAAQESLKNQAKQLMKEKQRKERRGQPSKKRRRRAAQRAEISGTDPNLSSQESDDKEDIIIKRTSKSPHPKLLDTVLQAVPGDSKTAHYIQYGFKSIASPERIPHLSIESYPPSPYLPPNSAGFQTTDISLRNYSSCEDIPADTSL